MTCKLQASKVSATHIYIHTQDEIVFGCAQAPQFSTADLGTRPAHCYLQFNTAAVKYWRWGDLGMRPAHCYLQFNTAAVKHWRWGDLFLFRDRFKTTDHSFYAVRYFSEN